VGVIFTVVFHILLLVLFLYIGLQQPDPLPQEEGIELAFEDAGGLTGGATVAQPATSQPPPEQTRRWPPMSGDGRAQAGDRTEARTGQPQPEAGPEPSFSTRQLLLQCPRTSQPLSPSADQLGRP
jgi:hypothetical protein